MRTPGPETPRRPDHDEARENQNASENDKDHVDNEPPSGELLTTGEEANDTNRREDA